MDRAWERHCFIPGWLLDDKSAERTFGELVMGFWGNEALIHHPSAPLDSGRNLD